MAIKLMVKCTTCGKIREATQAGIAAARGAGCYTSECCQAVATVEHATMRAERAPHRNQKKRERRC